MSIHLLTNRWCTILMACILQSHTMLIALSPLNPSDLVADCSQCNDLDKGPPGVQGPPGLRGPRGSIGPTGPAGGPTGPMGFTGPMGATGPTGPAGSSAGAMGDTGFTGFDGPIVLPDPGLRGFLWANIELNIAFPLITIPANSPVPFGGVSGYVFPYTPSVITWISSGTFQLLLTGYYEVIYGIDSYYSVGSNLINSNGSFVLTLNGTTEIPGSQLTWVDTFTSENAFEQIDLSDVHMISVMFSANAGDTLQLVNNNNAPFLLLGASVNTNTVGQVWPVKAFITIKTLSN